MVNSSLIKKQKTCSSWESYGSAKLYLQSPPAYCLDQYKLDKTNNSLNGLTWIKKGGGYYRICSTPKIDMASEAVPDEAVRPSWPAQPAAATVRRRASRSSHFRRF
ncbi:hypothetical protein ACOJBO_05315 [Rhizobium beringeri]